MLERRREKVMVGIVAALLAILGLDRLIVSPLLGYFSGIDERIVEVRQGIIDADETAKDADRIEADLARLRSRMLPANEEGQNDFRKFLESMIDPHVEIRSSRGVSVTNIPQAPHLRKLTFELEMTGPFQPLVWTLMNLDKSEQLLRVENLQFTNTSIDDTRLSVSITVSTIARHAERS